MNHAIDVISMFLFLALPVYCLYKLTKLEKEIKSQPWKTRAGVISPLSNGLPKVELMEIVYLNEKHEANLEREQNEDS